jgi:sugar/nucleoside kinase (ribokinase family)
MAFDDLELPTGKFPDTVGGSATYSALSCSAFAPARVVAVVGDDFPQPELDRLAARGVDVSGIERAKGKTFRWAGRYDADLVGRTSLDTQLNVFADFRPKIPADWRTTPLVLLGNIHPALQTEVLDRMQAPRLVVADTMNFWISGEPEALARLLKRVDVLIINDEEVRELSGIHNVRKAAAEVRRRGPKRLIVKRGEHGALLFDDAGIFAVPGFPLEDVVDPTGAGDSFAGGLIGYLATQADVSTGAIRRAMVHGTATASHCVEAVGTSRVAVLTAEGVERRVDEILRLFSLG